MSSRQKLTHAVDCWIEEQMGILVDSVISEIGFRNLHAREAVGEVEVVLKVPMTQR